MSEDSTPACYQTRVYHGHTDAGGVVHHAHYLCYFEEARAEWLRRLGIEQSQLWRDENLALPILSLQVNYRDPARLDDLLMVSCTLHRRRRAGLELHQEIRCGGRLLADATITLACVNVVARHVAALPEALRAAPVSDEAAAIDNGSA